jgi:hypothetical protein
MIDTVSQMDEVSRKCTVNCQFIIDIHLPFAQSSVMSRRRDERRGEERRGEEGLIYQSHIEYIALSVHHSKSEAECSV